MSDDAVFSTSTALWGILMASPLALVLLAVGVLALLIPYMESRKPFKDLPTPSGANHSHWLYGNAHLIFKRDTFPDGFMDVMAQYANAQGRTGLWLVHRRAISLVNIQDVRHVLKTEHYRVPVPVISHYVKKVIGAKNLLFLNGREWKQSRDAVTRTFVHSFLVQSQHDVHVVAKDLITSLSQRIDDTWSACFELDVHPIMKMVTSDVMGRAAFGTDFACCQHLEFSTVVGAFEYIMKDMGRRGERPLLPWNYFFALPTDKNRKVERQVHILRNFIQGLLQEARIKMKELDNNPSPRNSNGKNKIKISLVDRLVVAHANQQKEAGIDPAALINDYSTDQVLIDVICTLLIAAYDTTSTTLTMALYSLAMNPEVQDECYKEVQSVLQKQKGDNSQQLNPDDLAYCTAVIRETLRLYPPAAMASRTMTKPLVLPSDGYVVPKGVNCITPIFAIHRSEQYFPRPLECIPERWCQRSNTDDDEQSAWVERTKENDHADDASNNNGNSSSGTTIPVGNLDAWIPFSAGSRNCPGSKFAFQESVIVLANLVQAFKFKPTPGYKLKLDLHGPLPQPRHGMPLRIEKREVVETS